LYGRVKELYWKKVKTAFYRNTHTCVYREEERVGKSKTGKRGLDPEKEGLNTYKKSPPLSVGWTSF